MKSWAVFGILLFAISGLMVPQFSYAQDSTDSVNVSEWEEYDKDKILNDPFAQ